MNDTHPPLPQRRNAPFLPARELGASWRFLVKIIVGQLDTFTDSISHVSALDGISIMLPDREGHLQRPSIPQFIVSSLNRNGTLAVLDFTCAEQWKWIAA
jgi:hypothetical protein